MYSKCEAMHARGEREKRVYNDCKMPRELGRIRWQWWQAKQPGQLRAAALSSHPPQLHISLSHVKRGPSYWSPHAVKVYFIAICPFGPHLSCHSNTLSINKDSSTTSSLYVNNSLIFTPHPPFFSCQCPRPKKTQTNNSLIFLFFFFLFFLIYRNLILIYLFFHV